MNKDYSFTYQSQSVARYSVIQLSELTAATWGVNKLLKLPNGRIRTQVLLTESHILADLQGYGVWSEFSELVVSQLLAFHLHLPLLL